MESTANSVTEYLASIAIERRAEFELIRKVIVANLDPRLEEMIQYGMISYCVPLSLYPEGYHCAPNTPLLFAALASQKNYLSVYLPCAYQNAELKTWLEAEFEKKGLKLNMGKSCLRFKKLSDVPLDSLASLLQKINLDNFIQDYDTNKPRKKASLEKRQARSD